MSLLGFKKQFAGPVELRIKRQTIRAKCQGHVVGRPIQLYTGLRNKSCRKLVDEDPICTSIEAITIHHWCKAVMVDGLVIERDALALFAAADGFASVEEFFAFFPQDKHGADFAGWLIKWDWP